MLKHFLLFLPLLTEVKCCPVLDSTWGVPGRVYLEPSQWIFFCSPPNYHTLLFEPTVKSEVKKVWLRQSWNQSRCCTPLETGAWSRFTDIKTTRMKLWPSFWTDTCVIKIKQQEYSHLHTPGLTPTTNYWYNVQSVQLLKNSQAPSGDSSADFF